MVLRLNEQDPLFENRFRDYLTARVRLLSKVDNSVREIVSDVRNRGDKAIQLYTERFDGVSLDPSQYRIDQNTIANATEKISSAEHVALDIAAERIESHHKRQMPDDDHYTDSIGMELGHRWTPISSVGLYVPGGSAAYPSTVLMAAIPALVAGVSRIAMVTPCGAGDPHPLVLAAAAKAGITEIYRIGGAQGIAALAIGTNTIASVDKIIGPGNAYVSAAKRLVFGHVGIDVLAGPSEIVVLSDIHSDPNWVATDLLSQAEHDPNAQAILITDDEGFAERVAMGVAQRLPAMTRNTIATTSWENNGAIIIVENINRAPSIINQIAPEHVALAIENPDDIVGLIQNAGTIFLGRITPEAIGDYIAGTNHILPTSGSAKFSSGLSVYEFLKRISVVRCNPSSLENIGPSAITLAEAEGLDEHAQSIRIRLRAAAP